MKQKTVLTLLFGFLLLITAVFAEAYEKMMLGVVEKITLLPENVKLSAKLDTGAKTSSLGVTDMKIVEDNDEELVHFTVHTKKRSYAFVRKLEGYAKIKIRHVEKKVGAIDKGYVARPVVLMEVRLGDREQLIEVNLANRKNFIYPFLLGRDAIIKLGGVVDPNKRYTLKKVNTQFPLLD